MASETLSKAPSPKINILCSNLGYLQRPLQWFRHKPERHKEEDIAFPTYLLQQVKMGMGSGTVQDCLASQCLNNIEQLGMDEVELAYAISSPFGAGIETVRSIYPFLCADARVLLCRLWARQQH